MKKLILLLVLVFVAGNSAAQTVITTPAELQAMGDDLAGNYILGNDIDMEGITWEAIAYRDSGVDFVFTGTLDGNFNVIKNFTGIDDLSDTPYKTASLIGILGEGGVIKNLGMTNVNITMDGTQGTPNYVGAMVSDNKGEMSKCWLEGGTISVTGATAGNNAGSLVGALRGTGSITDCYVLGTSVTIDGMDGLGGFVNQSAGGTITNCYVAGAVDLTPRTNTLVAGFARISNPGEITNCYYNMDLTTFTDDSIPETYNPWDDETGLGRTTAQMMTQANYVGWDFVDTWTMAEGETYPTLIKLGATGPDPSNGETVLVNANLVLSWTNMEPNYPGDPVFVEVLFGTEPNEAHPGYDMEPPRVLDPVSGMNVTSEEVDASAEDTYYWQVNSWINGPDKLDDENKIEGNLWRFIASTDVAPTVEIVTPAQMTWSGEGVAIDATVDDDGISDLTILWAADAASQADPNLTIDIVGDVDPENPDATVTITKTVLTGDVVTVTMTVTVSDLGNPEEPDTASVEIDVYDDDCHVARVGLGRSAETDFNANCITGIEDLKEMLLAWLDDYSAEGQADR